MKLLIAFVITALSLLAQDGQSVNLSQGQTQVPYEKLFYPTGSNITTVCIAASGGSRQIPTVIAVSAASNASPVSFTATAHNIGDYATLGATITPAVKITGGTGNWAAINGVWKATPTSANAFTIAVDSTAFGALTGTLVVTTLAPRLNQPVWSIQKFTYDASNNVTSVAFVNLPGGAGATDLPGASTGGSFKCSDRATLTAQ